jgi:hypothetical protein
MVKLNGIPALLVLALGTACGPTVPDSGAGVGFDDYSSYDLRRAQRDAELEARNGGLVPPPGGAAPVISSEDLQRAGLPVPPPVTGAPLDSTGLVAPGAPAPVPGSGGIKISDEQDFDAVSARETIASDKERIAENRRAYEQIQPVDLPGRTGASDTVVIDFALSTTNGVGQKLYDRPKSSQDKFYRACAKYPSQDTAQEEFLKAGGPKKDSKGIDPDGDGFACFWDPTPFRLAKQGAIAAPVAREVLPVPGADVPAGN